MKNYKKKYYAPHGFVALDLVSLFASQCDLFCMILKICLIFSKTLWPHEAFRQSSRITGLAHSSSSTFQMP